MAGMREENGSRLRVFATLCKKIGTIVPGSALSQELACSRQAIYKAVCALKDEGAPIESIPQKGYRLGSLDDLQTISPTMIEYFLHGNPVFNRCLHFKEIDSTQTVIKKLARRGDPAGTVAVSERQTKGRGRRGRNWESPYGKNLMFSMLLRPKLKPGEVQLLNLAAGLAAGRALRELCGIPVELKWPNDILCSGRKLCGILSEASGEPDRIYYAVTGIGMNVNMELTDLPVDVRKDATSVKIELGHNFPRWRLLVDFLGRFASLIEVLSGDGGPSALIALYRESCDTIGKQVRVTQDGKDIIGVATNVLDNGALVVRTDEGDKVFVAADVHHLRMI